MNKSSKVYAPLPQDKPLLYQGEGACASILGGDVIVAYILGRNTDI